VYHSGNRRREDWRRESGELAIDLRHEKGKEGRFTVNLGAGMGEVGVAQSRSRSFEGRSQGCPPPREGNEKNKEQRYEWVGWCPSGDEPK
jgi:hypothetical protein